MNIFENQVAVVTGGNSGIGKAVSIDLAKNGAKVMVIGRNTKTIEETVNEIKEMGNYAEGYSLDVTNREEINNVINSIIEKHNKIEMLVCNAGSCTAPSFITDMDDKDWDGLIDVHLNGAYNFIKPCGKNMKKNNYGRIILMSSLAGAIGMTGASNYATVKTGYIGLNDTLATEFGPFGITVNVIQPGIIKTPLAEGIIQAVGEKFANLTPVRRNGVPEDISNAVTFLCSPKSSFINGATLRIDGGFEVNSAMHQFMFEACQQ